MASAKFANNTVNQSQIVICRLNLNAEPPRRSRTVVITLPISTTNITGLPIMVRGFNLRTASQSARLTIFHSQIAFFFFAIDERSERLACTHEQVLKNRAQAEGREKCQRPYNYDYSDQQPGETR